MESSATFLGLQVEPGLRSIENKSDPSTPPSEHEQVECREAGVVPQVDVPEIIQKLAQPIDLINGIVFVQVGQD